MKTTPSPFLGSFTFCHRILALCMATTVSTGLLFAANGTWDGGGANANWTTFGNWAGDAAYPGAISDDANADTATFNSAIVNTWGAPGTPILIDTTGLSIKNILFDTASVGNFTLGTTGGNALRLISGGVIRMSSTVGDTSTQTIAAPLVIIGENGSYSFDNARDKNTAKLIINGSISAGSSGNAAINFTSRQAASPNEVNGVISDGSATHLALNHNTGTWTYTGNNTYTGDTTINAGNARFTGNNSGGGNFIINAGATASLTGTNTYSGPFTLNGSASSVAQLNLGAADSTTGSILGVTQLDITSGRVYLINTLGNANRLNDAVAISLGGVNSILQLQGNGTTNTSETVGAITFGPGYSTLDLTNASGRVTTLNATSITRATGFGTAIIGSRTLGIGATQTGRIFLTTPPTGINLVGSGGSPTALATGVKNLAIIPWLYGSDNGVGRFLTYDSVTGLRYLDTNETQSTIAAAAAPGVGATGDNVLHTTTETGITTKIINSLMLTPGADQSITGAGPGNTLTLSSGALALTNARTTTFSGFDSITFGNSEGVLTTGHGSAVLRFDSAIGVTNNGGITKTGAGTLILNATNTYSGTTTINQGTLQIGTGGSTGNLGTSALINLRSGTTLNVNRTGTLTLGSVSGGGSIVINQAATLALTQTGSGNTLGTLSGVSGSTIAFNGTGETTIAGKLNTDGQLIQINSGTVNIANSRQTAANLEITGGVVNTLDPQLSMRRNTAGTQTLTISGGTFNVINSYGAKGLNNDSWANTNLTHFIGTQTGGTFNIAGTGSDDFQLGSDFAGATTSYTLSGGRLNYTGASNFIIGANTAGTSTSTFTLSGGTLKSKGTIQGRNGTDAKQAFIWTGGVLATVGFNATNLSSTANTSVSTSSGTLTNAGGLLAPGDIGTTGRTTITGNYAVTSANAGLYIDIAGTTASNAFQDAATTGRHDQVYMNGPGRAVTLGGKLYVNLLDGYNGTGSFVILTNTGSGGSITGTFSNTVTDSLGEGVRVVLDNGIGSFLVDYNLTNVTLGTYIADNAWAGYDGADWSEASNWSAFSPQAAGHLAQFTSAVDGGAVTLDTDLTIGGITFDNADYSYTISSGSARTLTLDNTRVTGATDSTLTVANGTHTVAVPVVLNTNLAVMTTGTGSGLTLSGAISGTGKSVTKSGTGSLTLTGANTYTGGTTVSAGSLFVNNTTGSGTGTGALSIAATALLGGSGRIGSVTTIHGSIAPGAIASSTAVLTFDNAVTFKTGSSLAIDINGAATRGADYDGIHFNGALTIEGGSLTFNISTAIADNSVLTIFTGTDLTAGFTSVVASGSGTGGAYNGALTFNAGPSTYSGVFGDQTLILDLANGTLSFTGNAIPEPAAAAALLGAATLALGTLRRRPRTQA